MKDNQRYDVAVIGGGPAGCCAAIAAAKRGARTLLVDSAQIPGGNLLTGMSVDGAVNARGEYIIGGVARLLFGACAELGGFIGPVNDYGSSPTSAATRKSARSPSPGSSPAMASPCCRTP